MLRPEKQDFEAYVDGIKNIVEAQQRVAKIYFEDGSIEHACPPLRALLHIMAHGNYEGKTADHPEIRILFGHDTIVQSDWYAGRLETQAKIDRKLWTRHVESLSAFQEKENYRDEIRRLNIAGRLRVAQKRMREIEREGYVKSLRGHLGADPSLMGS
jgi:hypothetical protein